MRVGAERVAGSGYSAISPVEGSRLPMLLAAASVNHSLPSRATMPVGSESGRGVAYSATSPVAGSMLPIRLTPGWVNQTLPSGPDVMSPMPG